MQEHPTSIVPVQSCGGSPWAAAFLCAVIAAASCNGTTPEEMLGRARSSSDACLLVLTREYDTDYPPVLLAAVWPDGLVVKRRSAVRAATVYYGYSVDADEVAQAVNRCARAVGQLTGPTDYGHPHGINTECVIRWNGHVVPLLMSDVRDRDYLRDAQSGIDEFASAARAWTVIYDELDSLKSDTFIELGISQRAQVSQWASAVPKTF